MKGKHITTEEAQAIALEYKSGRSLDDIAAEFQVTVGTVREIGRESGYTRADTRLLRFLESADGQAAFCGIRALDNDLLRDRIREGLKEADYGTVPVTVYPEGASRRKLSGRNPKGKVVTDIETFKRSNRGDYARYRLQAQLLSEERDEAFYENQENVA